MWPYTQDEVTWLASQPEREAEDIRRAMEQRWLKEIGVAREPANDISSVAVRMVDPRY